MLCFKHYHTFSLQTHDSLELTFEFKSKLKQTKPHKSVRSTVDQTTERWRKQAIQYYWRALLDATRSRCVGERAWVWLTGEGCDWTQWGEMRKERRGLLLTQLVPSPPTPNSEYRPRHWCLKNNSGECQSYKNSSFGYFSWYFMSELQNYS